MPVWPELAGLEDDVAWALFLLARRVRGLADDPPTGLMRWVWGADVRDVAPGIPEIENDLRFLSDERLALTDSTGSKAARSCQRIAEWAAGRGFTRLAVRFAEAGVAMRPQSAQNTYEAARLHRLFGNSSDAEILYNRAVCLARSSRRWSIYVRAHLGLGLIQKTRGAFEMAAAHFGTASKAAWKLSGEKWLAGTTEHDLLLLRAEQGALDAAMKHAQNALMWLPTHHESVPWLAHDYCLILLRTGAYQSAISLLKAILAKVPDSPHRAIAWSTLGRAAGGSSNVELYREAEQAVCEEESRFNPHSAAAHANLAAGAHMLRLNEDADAHARLSIRLAIERGDAIVLAAARELLRAIQDGKSHFSQAKLAAQQADIRYLTTCISRKLARWRGPTWKRKRQAGRHDVGDI